MVSFINTGRYAIESARFDRERPVIVDVGTPVLSWDAPTEARLAVEGSVISFGPDLLNPGQSVDVRIVTAQPPDRDALERGLRHALADIVVEVRRRRPAGRVRRYAPFAAAAALLLAPVTAAVVDSRGDIASYLLPRPTATITPDHGPSSGCVTIRGQNFDGGEPVNIWISGVSIPYGGYSAPKGCLVLDRSDKEVRSSVTGEIYFAFALPPGCTGQITIFLQGDRDGAVTYWVT